MILEILLWLLLSYVALSFAEWFAHRYVMHRRVPFLLKVFHRHTTLHHGKFYHNFENDPNPLAKEINIEMSVSENLLLGMPVLIPLYFLSPLGVITLGGCIAAHAILWSAIHLEMHEPSGTWFSRFRLYKFFRDYHLTHHQHPRWNFNVVCPLADFVFGTYRRLGPQRKLLHED